MQDPHHRGFDAPVCDRAVYAAPNDGGAAAALGIRRSNAFKTFTGSQAEVEPPLHKQRLLNMADEPRLTRERDGRIGLMAAQDGNGPNHYSALISLDGTPRRIRPRRWARRTAEPSPWPTVSIRPSLTNR